MIEIIDFINLKQNLLNDRIVNAIKRILQTIELNFVFEIIVKMIIILKQLVFKEINEFF